MAQVRPEAPRATPTFASRRPVHARGPAWTRTRARRRSSPAGRGQGLEERLAGRGPGLRVHRRPRALPRSPARGRPESPRRRVPGRRDCARPGGRSGRERRRGVDPPLTTPRRRRGPRALRTGRHRRGGAALISSAAALARPAPRTPFGRPVQPLLALLAL